MSDRPLKSVIDIVTVVYNKADYVKATIESLFDGTDLQYTYTIVHNASPYPDTGEYIDHLESGKIAVPQNCVDFKVVHNQSNLGVSSAYNIGFKRGSSKVICKLDDDVILPKGWLPPMLIAFDTIPNLGACSTYLTEDSSGINPGLGSRSDGHADYPLFFNYPNSRCNITIETEEYHTIGGWCLVTLRNLFDRVGGFDERQLYGIADGLYSQSLRYIGYKVCYIKNVVTMHLARTPASDQRYDDWKTEYATGLTRDDFSTWRDRKGDNKCRPLEK